MDETIVDERAGTVKAKAAPTLCAFCDKFAGCIATDSR